VRLIRQEAYQPALRSPLSLCITGVFPGENMRTMAAVAAATLTFAIGAAAPAVTTTPLAATWRSAEILAPSNARADPVATLDAVACAAAGSCAGGGSYQSKSGAFEPMVVTEASGTWKRAQELSLPANAFVANPDASVASIACPSAGTCVAVGGYVYDSAGLGHAFTAAQSKGVWARAQQVTLPANAATRGGDATLGAVTCTSAGSCVAVGGYVDKAGDQELMAVTESGGRWGQARQIASPKNAAGSGAVLDGVSCWRPGDCAAVGDYADTARHGQALATVETNGRWARATEIAVPRDAGPDPGAQLTGVACSPTGSCTAAGGYFDKSAASHAMVATGSGRGWARATEIKAPAATGFVAPFLDGISCVAAGTCEAVGSYLNEFAAVPMAVTQSAGKWQPAANVPPPANELTGMFRDAALLSVACLKGHACTALGWYVDKSNHQEAMAATRPAP
jgi:hypothetical protein